jgi:GntR family transcriptional regulator
MIGRYNRLSRPRDTNKSRQRLPLYQQLKEFLNERIESGEWQPGHQLPTEVQLSSEFGVSRVTVRQAMELLARQGLVERKQGRGTFVGRPKVAHNLLSMFTSGADIRRTTGQVPQLGLYELKQVDATAGVQAHLKLEPGDKVYQLRRTLRADNEPLMLINSWLPVSLLPGLEDRGLNHRTIREVLLDYGITATHQYKEVEVTLVGEEEAEVLDTRPGSPALLMTYVSERSDGVPFEYRKMVVRGDRCKYYVDINLPEPLL